MSRIKTKSGAKKRFKVTGSGKIKHKRAYKRHILTKKKTDRKRRLSSMKLVDKTDLNNIRPMIPYIL